MSSSVPPIEAITPIRSTDQGAADLSLSTLAAADAMAVPLPPGQAVGSGSVAEGVFNAIVDAAADAVAEDATGTGLPGRPNAGPSLPNAPPGWSGAVPVLPGQQPPGAPIAPGLHGGLPATPLPNLSAALPAVPPSVQLPAVAVTQPSAVLPAPVQAEQRVEVRADASARPGDAGASRLPPPNAAAPPVLTDAVSLRAPARAEALAAGALAGGAAAVMLSGTAGTAPGPAVPGQVMQLAMLAMTAQPLETNPEEDGPLLPYTKRQSSEQDEGDFYDDIEEEWPPAEEPKDDGEAKAPEPRPIESDHRGEALQAMPPANAVSTEGGLFEQLCEALERLADEDSAAGFVQQVFDELNRRRRVVVVSPDRVVRGSRVAAYVDVLCPAAPRGVAVRLAGELIWAGEAADKPWALAHVFKSQTASEGKEFVPVDGSVCTHTAAVCLGLQNLPANVSPQVCVRVIDANRLWQMLASQWSLRVVISPEPLSTHRYSP